MQSNLQKRIAMYHSCSKDRQARLMQQGRRRHCWTAQQCMTFVHDAWQERAASWRAAHQQVTGNTWRSSKLHLQEHMQARLSSKEEDRTAEDYCTVGHLQQWHPKSKATSKY